MWQMPIGEAPGIHGAEGRPSAQLFLRFYGSFGSYTNYAKYISSLQILQIEIIPLNIWTRFGLTSGSMSSELLPGPPNAAWVLLFR